MTVRERLEFVLARHFFAALFDFGLLTDDGAESLKRALLGTLAVALGLGLLITRVYMIKYAVLSSGPAEALARAVVADHAFLIAVPMWFVAAALGLVGHSLFPDETDFHVLMAEPVSRAMIFGAKLAALLLFATLVVVGAHAALLPVTLLTLIGHTPAGAMLGRTLAFAVAAMVASLFAALAIVAVHGTLALLAPRARLVAFSGAVRSVMIGLLVLSLPLVIRLPGAANAFATNAWWLGWAPPSWFVGLEGWLIGDPRHPALATRAVFGLLVVSAVSVASYLTLYRRFDRVTVQSAGSPRRRGRSLGAWNGPSAFRRFAAITLRRSVLHQGVVVGLLGAAVGFVLNILLGADIWRVPVQEPSTRETWKLLWAPMTVVFFAVPSVRLAMSLPLDVQSNWIFRMTEDVAGRAEVHRANVYMVFALGVLLPIGLFAPLQWWNLGHPMLRVVLVEAAIGWLLVEWVMATWRRIPFTCSYIPGKGFVPHMFAKAFLYFVLFSTVTGAGLRLALASVDAAVACCAACGVAAAVLSLHRTHRARSMPLIFEEELPSDVTTLRLQCD
jgi:hypothetical protein